MSDEGYPLLLVSSFSGDEGAINTYRWDVATGHLHQVSKFEDVKRPFYFALSPDRQFLYSNHAPTQFGGTSDEQVAAYRVDRATNQLTLLNRQPSLGSETCHLSVDRQRRMLVAANYETGSIALFPIAPDGSLGSATAFIQHTGASMDPARQAGPHAHCVVFSPDNRFICAADLGINQLIVYEVETSGPTASLKRVSHTSLEPGAGPRHLHFHPHGKLLYVVNELSNSVTSFDWNAAIGALSAKQTISTLPPEYSGESCCADLAVAHDGHWLYATNRGHDSIAAFAIDGTGRLERLGNVPSGGKEPQNLAISPDGRFLLCANMEGNSLAVFSIDANTGALTSAGSPQPMVFPSCVKFL